MSSGCFQKFPWWRYMGIQIASRSAIVAASAVANRANMRTIGEARFAIATVHRNPLSHTVLRSEGPDDDGLMICVTVRGREEIGMSLLRIMDRSCLHSADDWEVVVV